MAMGNSPGQNTGIGSLSFLQGIFPIQGSNSGLPHCIVIVIMNLKLRLLHMADAEQLERWISQDWGLVMKTDREGAKVHCKGIGVMINGGN